MAKTLDQKAAIAKAYGDDTLLVHLGTRSGAAFRPSLTPRQLDRIAKQREELQRRMAAMA